MDSFLNSGCKKRNVVNFSSNDDCSINCKFQKFDDISSYTNIVDDWISEYKKWYSASFDQDMSKLSSTVTEFKKQRDKKTDIRHYTSSISSENFIVLSDQTTDSTPILNSCNVPSQYTNVILPMNIRNIGTLKNVGYWGPLLRYGTYGIYKIYGDNVILKKRRVSFTNNIVNDVILKESLPFPLDPPLSIKMPRQAMLCTLQSYAQIKISDLKKLESDPLLHMGINYSTVLEQVTSKCGTCPKYLFTKVSNIPSLERDYFTPYDESEQNNSYMSIDCSKRSYIKSIEEFYACELFVSDILLSQGFALWKRRAMETCARKAFKVLQNPCILVGSTRYWRNSDFLTACIAEDLQKVPLLPPFFTDPTEPLYKKDDRINKSDPEENFDISNPKSISDFWLYAPTLLTLSAIKNVDPQILLYQSAEFSQMNISFEIDTIFDESFSCTIYLDKSPAVTVDGLGSLAQARHAASLVLVDKLADSQPIVALHNFYHEKYENILNDDNLLRSNHFIVHSLMWSPIHICKSVPFKDLSEKIKSELLPSNESFNKVSSQDFVEDLLVLSYLLNCYAQSSLIYPVIMNSSDLSDDLWRDLTDHARTSGLLVLHDHFNGDPHSVLICKYIPHRKMKAVLLGKGELGVFRLLSEGSLPEKYLTDLKGFLYEESISEQDTDSEESEMEDDEDDFLPKRGVPKGDIIPGLDF